MKSFVDPRLNPRPTGTRGPVRLAEEVSELEELHRFCQEGRLYAVEEWIRSGRPLQAGGRRAPRQRRALSALEIALERRDHALTLLLLANGYDADLEPRSALDRALDSRRTDLVELLLTWGADPHRIDLRKRFDTYSTELFQRFYDVGVDLTARHAMAAALGYSASNKPLFGFAKRHQAADPAIRRELSTALAHHTSMGREKGALLCLWAGADPHEPVPALSYYDDYDVASDYDVDEAEEEDDEGRWNAVYAAAGLGSAKLLKRMAPDPELESFQALYERAGCAEVVDVLARQALPSEMTPVVLHRVWASGWYFESRDSLATLRRMFEQGARWTSAPKEELGEVRRAILNVRSGYRFTELVLLLGLDNHCAPEILQEIARTPAFQRRLQEEELLPRPGDRYWIRRREAERMEFVMRAYGLEPPAARKPPRPVTLGAWRAGREKLHLTREAFCGKIWSRPLAEVASEWGKTEAALKLACNRLKIPLPTPRQAARLERGESVRRPQLEPLRKGQAEEVVLWREAARGTTAAS